jgi:hypothetical protein
VHIQKRREESAPWSRLSRMVLWWSCSWAQSVREYCVLVMWGRQTGVGVVCLSGASLFGINLILNFSFRFRFKFRFRFRFRALRNRNATLKTSFEWHYSTTSKTFYRRYRRMGLLMHTSITTRPPLWEDYGHRHFLVPAQLLCLLTRLFEDWRDLPPDHPFLVWRDGDIHLHRP